MIHFTHKSTQSFARCWILLICAVWIFSSVHVSPAADLSGEWQGRWESFPTGHKGPLRATFTRLDEHSYRADFSGRFWMLLPFRYSVVLDGVV